MIRGRQHAIFEARAWREARQIRLLADPANRWLINLRAVNLYCTHKTLKN